MDTLNIVFYIFLAILTIMITAFNYTIHKSIKGDYKNLRNNKWTEKSWTKKSKNLY